MSDQRLITGAGGGGGGGKGGGSNPTKTPTTAKDGLNSASYAKLVDLLCEGEIQGLKNGGKSIYLNNTPLQNPDNSYNFQNVTFFTRNGTQAQSFVPGFDELADEKSVGTTVLKSTPVTRTVTDTTTNAVRVTISVPQLQQIKDNGDIVGSKFQLQIAVQYNGGGYTTKITDTVEGRSGDLYQRDYLIQLDGAFPVDVRVIRVTDDSTDPKVANAFSWFSYTEITYGKLRYPNSAIVAMRIDAEQFNSIPQRSYLIRGLKVAIPSNATVDSTTGRLIYSGTWNGTFGAAQWCSDPSWCLWDLLTNSRYGFGDHLSASQLDKWAFYAASQYCSELVADGFGGQEPRFSCNVNIQTAEDAYKLINDMCSVFRAMPYWSVGSLTMSQDKPATSSYLFTLANVSEEGFSYAGSSQKTRSTVAIVAYFDIALRDVAYEVVEDQAAIAKYGAVTKSITAFACTSRGQAHRLGEWLLYSEQYETEVLTFTASIEAGVVVRPGQIIDVSDPVRAGARCGGRLKSVTSATTVVLDNTSGLPGSLTGATLSVVLPSGTVETRTISSLTGSTVVVSSAFSVAPNPNTVWVLQTPSLQTSQWRVLTVTEQDGAQYVITALSYNSSKYAYVERGAPLEQRDTTNLNEQPAAPTLLTFSEALYTYQNQVRAKIIAKWRPVNGVNLYEIRWRKDSGNWTVERRQGPDYEVLDITPGLFEFKIYSLNAAGTPSTTALTGSLTALGKTAPPSDVTGFTSVIDANIGALLTWNPISDLDAAGYEIRSGGTNWATATLVTKVTATSYKLGQLAPGTTTYRIKALDTSGVYSTNAVSTIVTIAAPAAPAPTASVEGDNVVLKWSAVAGTYATAYYELRASAGSLAAQIKTTSFLLPITWAGARTFYVKAVDLAGNASAEGSVVVTITQAPAPTISYAYAGNSITLAWTEVAGSTTTRSYEIRRGSVYASAQVVASSKTTSFSLLGDWIGNQTFWIAAVDANGNLGTAGSVVVPINLPSTPTLLNRWKGEQVQLYWDPVTASLDVAEYEVRRGSVYASATVLGRIKGTTFNVKVDWLGTQKFWVVGIDTLARYGTPDDQDVIVTAPIAPPSLTQQVIDNNVLLKWNDATQTLPIVYYELRRGSTWAGGTVIGTKQGQFTTVFETSSGTYTYWLAGVDTAGNYGAASSVTATVNQPPDYVLNGDFNSTFSGTKTNSLVDNGALLAMFDTTETWQSHFTSRGWTTLQDQINAGYTFYLLPSQNTGKYEETIDYGAVLAGTKVSVTPNWINISGSTTVTPSIAVRKLTTDPWTSYAGASSVYVTDIRYIRVTLDFAGAGGDDLVQVIGLNVRLDSKIRNDTGVGTANASDSGGTVVTFNVAFVDVQGISVTPSGTTPRIAIYDFVDAPNPTSFKVLLFDTSGNRVSGGFSWQARGT